MDHSGPNQPSEIKLHMDRIENDQAHSLPSPIGYGSTRQVLSSPDSFSQSFATSSSFLSSPQCGTVAREEYQVVTSPKPSELTSPSYQKRDVDGHGKTYRYLKACEINSSISYDFAIIAFRSIDTSSSVFKWCVKSLQSPEDVSPRHDVQQRVAEILVEKGLQVDIVDAGFDNFLRKGRGSDYFVLLIRATDSLVKEYAHKMNFQRWLRCGNAREVESVVESEVKLSPADRIQVVDYIIREVCRITEKHPFISKIFPIHDKLENEKILKDYFHSRKVELYSEEFIQVIRHHFGEKVAYYFAFLDFYNKSLWPIAILGILLTIARRFISVENYIKILVFWGFLVSILWSFCFLKTWDRKTNEINFKWQDSLHPKRIMYPNPNFHGTTFTNPVTNQMDMFYAKWKRYPIYLMAFIFMLIQILLMMLVIAIWITVFEVLKVRFPDGSFLSAQWFCILLGGICFGLFVDVLQWNIIVSKAGKLFTEWENWKTIEQYECALIRKLFIMDFLNYYTWFFLLAFVYVIPGAGDRITNLLNTIFWNDPSNCCFGPYLDQNKMTCKSCPYPWNGVVPTSFLLSFNACEPCNGWATFDRNHLDLEQLFLTPIIVTQGLNLLLAVLLPWLNKKQQERSRKFTDCQAMKAIQAKGQRKIIAEMEYREDTALLSNMSKARYIENDEYQVETLNALAREVLFQGGQRDYDPYDDYHLAAVQYGFVVMFSMLWPLMPVACIVINTLKMRGDGYRLCKTLKRPYPRKANGIGEWRTVLYILGCTGVLIFYALVFVSTGAIEFYSEECVAHIKSASGGNFISFHLGPDFSCFSLTERIIMLLITEHITFGILWIFHRHIRNIPTWLDVKMMKREHDFKLSLYNHTLNNNKYISKNKRGSQKDVPKQKINGSLNEKGNASFENRQTSWKAMFSTKSQSEKSQNSSKVLLKAWYT